MSNEFKVAVKLQADASQYTAEFTKAGQTAQAFNAQLVSGSATAGSAVQAVAGELQAVGTAASGANTASAALDKAAQSARQVGGAISVIPQQLQGVAAQFVATGNGIAGVAGQAKGLQASVSGAKAPAKDLADILVAAGDKGASGLARADKQTQNLGISAKQTAAAMRGVPAQITDIVVGLQGGQAPLTVMLQQGGQLKDMFGGTVPAVRALSSAVVGMVNPFTLAVAGAGVAILAYKQGSAEADGYRASIVMSGNAAGTSVGQLTDMARAISQVTGTQGAAAAALTQMAGSGDIARQNLQQFASVAMGLEKYVGVPVKATVADLEQLGKAPLQASVKLNEQYHYLTEAVYSHIKSLDEQGRKEEAGAAAQQAYMAAMESRKNEMVANLGYIERAWGGVTGAAKGAWDAMLNVGRATTDEQNLAQLRENLSRQQERNGNLGIKEGQATLDLKEQIRLLEKKITLTSDNAAATADQAKQTAAVADWDKVVVANLSKQAVEAREVESIRNRGLAAGRSAVEIEQQIAAYRAKNADKGASGAATRELERQRGLLGELAGLSSTFYKDWEGLNKQFKLGKLTQEQLTQEQEKLLAKQPSIKAAREAELKVMQAQYAVQQQISDEIAQAEVARSKAAYAGRQAVIEYSKGIDEATRYLEAERDTVAGTASQRALAIELLRIQIDLEKQLEAIKSNEGFDQADRDEQTAQAQAAAAQARANATSRAELDHVRELRTELQKTTEQYEQGLTNAAIQGGKSLKEYVLGMLRATAFRIILQPIMGPLAGLLASATGGAGGSVSGGGMGGIANLFSLGSNAASLYSTGLAGWVGSGVGSIFGTAAGNAALGTTLGLGPSSSIAAANAASMAGGGSGVLGMGGVGSSSIGAMGAGGIFAAVALAIANAFGIFKEDRQVGGGLTGTLGGDRLSNYALWRESGSLFGGPEYSVMDPEKQIAESEARLAKLRASEGGGGQQAVILQTEINNLKEMYADLIAGTKAQSDAIQGAYSALRTNVGDMADVLGLSSEAVRNFTTTLGSDLIHPDTGGRGLKFDGLNQEEIAAKIQEALATANNELAQQVIGTWESYTDTLVETVERNVGGEGENANRIYEEITTTTSGMRYVASEYAKDGEEAIDTLTRLATNLSTVNKIWETLGYTMFEASLRGADAAANFAEAFGSLENFGVITASYYENFYSEDEKKANIQKQLDQRFEDMGVEAPTSREEYRKLVDETVERANQQAVTREELASNITGMGAGDKKITLSDLSALDGLGAIDPGLLGDGPANPEAEAKINRFLTDLNAMVSSGLSSGEIEQGVAGLIKANAAVLGIGDDAAKTAAELMELGVTFASLTASAEEQAAARKAAAREETDAAYAAMQRSIDARKEELQAEIDLRTERIDSARALIELMRDNVRELRGNVASTAAMSVLAGNAYIDSALGAMLKTGYLPESGDGKLAEAISAARGGLTTDSFRNRKDYEAAQLILANKLEVMGDMGAAQLTIDELLLEQSEAEVDRLDLLLKDGKEALDIARGQVVATKDVSTAVREFHAALVKEQETGSGSSTGSPTGGGGSSGATFGPGSPAPTVNSKYKQVVSGGTAGVFYQPITDKEKVARLDSLAPVYHGFDGTGDIAGLWAAIKAAGGNEDDLSVLSGNFASDWRAALRDAGVPGFEGGGNHIGGLRLVGEDGPELEITGPSRIHNARQTQQLLAGLQGGGDQSEVVAAIKQLQQQGYDIGRSLIVLLQSVEGLARKSDRVGVKQREPA
ncbi:MAG: phage tail length tape measure family protein [Gammaproteobacteria bacterium]|nr:phage tail length tape measure family protein [Gammaproteobacteria bacterium]MBU1505775.1 phage tail length tape measure family protein [Gammaproteobacteria bacterium]MBU2119463.1 phage tail length tape measure family protein [Gammaproteobacteria bacterium]MBU2172631.1 phage tail length tape measure family protein [Gammaproteobacteria bacterium]MBU2202089.1 phage tail length tape measure family protein [Gammaproteobacteria bacterium]